MGLVANNPYPEFKGPRKPKETPKPPKPEKDDK